MWTCQSPCRRSRRACRRRGTFERHIVHRILRAAWDRQLCAAQTRTCRAFGSISAASESPARARATPNVLLGGVANGWLAREYLHDAIGARASLLGEHDHEIGHVHDGEQGLRHVVHERHDLPLRKGARSRPESRPPTGWRTRRRSTTTRNVAGLSTQGQTPHGDRGVRLAERRVGKTAPARVPRARTRGRRARRTAPRA